MLLAGLMLAGPAAAQQLNVKIDGLTERGRRELEKNPIPDLTAGGEKNDKHDWNLGPTGARGWMWGLLLRTQCARQIVITKVEAGSPADGVLQVGDVILGVGGQPFDSDARIAFGKAIAEAEKAENEGKLRLIRWRDGATETVTVPLKVMGTYGPLAPMDCEKSSRILSDACAYIARNGVGKGIAAYVNALGLLASGEEAYLPLVRSLARQVKVEDAYGMSSWNMSYLNIFLCEYHLLTGDKEVLPKIRQTALYLAKGQSAVGTWGHGNILPSGVLGGYGAMCLPTLSCAVSLQLSQKCGVDDPALEQAIGRSEVFFSSFVNKGGIPYGDHTPMAAHDSNGRCSLAAIFFDLLDNPESFEFFARMTVASYGEREEGHTGNYWSFLWGPLGAMRAGPHAAAAFCRELAWFFDLERRWDGGFTYQGGANMSGSEHTTPGWDTTGARVLMYAMAKRKLHLTGKNLTVAKALTGKALEDALMAGRDHNTWRNHGLIDTDSYDALPTDELYRRLVTWSAPMRTRAAKALAKKDGDQVAALTKMLASDDPLTVLGGVYGLEHQRQGAEPAIDALVGLLSHDDVWIRFRAGVALCAIGEPARAEAVPALLKSAGVTSKDDPRQMHQRYVSFVLWGGGYNGSPRGLLTRDMKGVDPALLVPAIRQIMRNPNGQARGYLAKAIKQMSPEELAPLWADVVWGVRHPAPSGIMFNSGIREAGLELLAQYRFKEAIPLAAEYARSMKQHGSQERIYRVMKTLTGYGAAAKSQLQHLYETRKYYEENLGPGKPLEFPIWARDKFMKGLNEGIEAIENATETPTDLRSLEEFE